MWRHLAIDVVVQSVHAPDGVLLAAEVGATLSLHALRAARTHG